MRSYESPKQRNKCMVEIQHWAGFEPRTKGRKTSTITTELKKMFSNAVVLGIVFNPFPHNDTFRRPWEASLLKTL